MYSTSTFNFDFIPSMLNKFIDDLPAQADAMKNIIDNFDKDKYQEVIRFAEAVNGNRPIPARS